MNVKALINEKYNELEIHVCNDSMTPVVADLISSINKLVNNGFQAKADNGDIFLIYSADIISVYAENQKVYIRTMKGSFETVLKLYELEEQLDSRQFFRISRSEIVNIKRIKKLDLGLSGTIKIILSDGSESYTSRRNVTKLKQALCIK